MNETQLTIKVKQMLSSFGAYHEKIFGGGFQAGGIPDILACLNGYFIGIELKSPTEKGRPRDLQLIKVMEIRKAGGIAFFSHDLSEVEYVLSQVKHGTFNLDDPVIQKIYRNYF